MNLQLNIAYATRFGEELQVNIRDDKSGGFTAYRMHTEDGLTWRCDLKVPRRCGTRLDYYYNVVEGEQHLVRSEWTTVMHRLEMNATLCSAYTVYDRWNDFPADSYLYSSAFTECIEHKAAPRIPECPFARTLRLKVRAPQLDEGQRLVVTGNDKALGKWDAEQGVPMYEHNYNEWIADINADRLTDNTFECKFAIIDKRENGKVIWEDCYNRELDIVDSEDGVVLVYELETALFPICDKHFAGTLVPVFSLRSHGSYGVGDFGDLKRMVDWVALTKQRLLQILPVNDTTTTHTWTDSYPYSCISIFALHPQYADLRALPRIADEEKRKAFETLRKELNALPQIDYERVNNAKNEYLVVLFAQEGKRAMATTAYKEFFAANEEWLVPYAQYCFLRDKYGTADFTAWKDHKTFDERERKALSTPGNDKYKDVAYYYYVQYVLCSQMASVHAYARQRGVILKGDIPIGVSRYGCDVWQSPRYFNLSGQAGAPPDDFSANGQNWGFPTYNWDEMVKDGCRWWVRRFANMANYFDAYRIDHVLGFFRIWEIPIDAVHGLLGQFAPALGMTREEIEAYGLRFQEELFTEPFITDWVLDRMFGERAKEITEKYLLPTHDGRYKLREQYNTQRKIEAAFAGKSLTDDVNLRDGLYALVSDVLFVRDHKDKTKYHPRISVQFDFIYESLYDSDKQVFNRIYNDYFYRRNNHFWYREAMNKLPKIVGATRMLVCAEDLGMVPDCVPWAMNDLRILSLELQSMPKDASVCFGVLANNPYRSVCTISSHDMPTLRQWWDEDYVRTQDYYNSVLGKYGYAPHPLPGWLARDIIARHLACPSMLCILSIQDWLSIDESLRLANPAAERVNIPSNPHHYWRYRMHVSIEELLASTDFNQNLTDLIRENNRMV